MRKEIVLVTGSTDGIGKATALKLAEQGYHVLIHGRNPGKGRAVLDGMRKRTDPDRLDLLIADLSEQRQVRNLADEVLENYGQLDVLINNAGVYMPERTLTPDGIEMIFAVNFLAQFLLSHELLPLLKQSAPARIVNVASIAHRSAGRINWGDLPGGEHYDSYNAYAVSKLGVVAFTYRLSEMIEGTGVTANCLHPGVIDTKLLRAYAPNHPGAPPGEGAEVEVYVATSPEVEGVSGKYFEQGVLTRSSRESLNPAVQDRFWRIAAELTGLREGQPLIAERG